MAKIPLAESTERLATQASSARQVPATLRLDVSTDVAKASQELAVSAANIAKRFQEAQTLDEKARADTLATRRLNELQLEAETTEDIWNVQEFKNRIGKIKEETTKGITLPQAKNEFGRIFDSTALVSEFNIRKILRARQVDATVSDINENMAALRESFIAGDAQGRSMAEAKRDTLLSDAISRGMITANSARKSREAMTKEWRLAKIDADIEKDAEVALLQLQLGEQGLYADVDAGDRQTKEGRAIQRISRDAAIARRNLEEKTNEAELKLANNILNEQATERMVNEAELLGTLGAEGGISREFAVVARRAVNSIAAVTAKTQAGTFNALQDQFVALNIKVRTKKGTKRFSTKASFEDLANFRVNVMNAWAEGKITRAVGQNWLNTVSQVFDKALAKETEKLVREDVEKGELKDIQNFWGWLSFWSDEFAEEKEETKARLGVELMDRLVNTPEDGDAIMDDLIEREQKAKNPNRAMYKLDQKVNTPSGVWKVVDFDGDGEPIMELIK